MLGFLLPKQSIASGVEVPSETSTDPNGVTHSRLLPARLRLPRSPEPPSPAPTSLGGFPSFRQARGRCHCLALGERFNRSVWEMAVLGLGGGLEGGCCVYINPLWLGTRTMHRLRVCGVCLPFDSINQLMIDRLSIAALQLGGGVPFAILDSIDESILHT